MKQSPRNTALALRADQTYLFVCKGLKYRRLYVSRTIKIHFHSGKDSGQNIIFSDFFKRRFNRARISPFIEAARERNLRNGKSERKKYMLSWR